ncbi:MAG TPA: hypothetical protein VMD59_03210, partial [Acidimicrobiales bacterium]|nr:hypothetical protein [Acidimicrobiales bacterium]
VHEGLFSLAVGPLVRAFFSYLTDWVGAGAAALVTACGHVLEATGGPDLGPGLAALMTRTLAIGVALCLPLMLLAIVRGIVRQELGLAVRTVLVRLPLAALLGSGALEVVRLGVAATDQMSASLLDAVSEPFSRLVSGITDGLAEGGGSLGLTGFGVFVLAVTTAVVAFLLWIELVVRSAAIEVATLFLPLAFAGLLWPATAHWARRLAETLAALVLAKLVIAGVLALSVATIGTASGGAAAAVQGVALLLLATFSPYALLRLVPMVEAGSIAHLEGLGRRFVRATASAVSTTAAQLPAFGAEAFDAGSLIPPAGGQRGIDALGFVPTRFDATAFESALPAELSRLRHDGDPPPEEGRGEPAGGGL